MPTPLIMGHEAAGVVEAVGENVRSVRPGDHVVVCLSLYCGHCEHCVSGFLSRCDDSYRSFFHASPGLKSGDDDLYQMMNIGGFAEQLLVNEKTVVRIREEMPLDIAAVLGCAVITGVGAVMHTARVTPGSRVAVIGCGGVGLNAINGAAIAGAGQIIAIDRVPEKLVLAKKFGATDVIDASSEGVVERVQELSGGGVHFSFEVIGLKQTAEQALAMLRKGGVATMVGVPKDSSIPLELPASEFSVQEKSFRGSFMGTNQFPIDIPRYVDYYLRGLLHLDELVSDRISLEQVNDGLANLQHGRVARQIIQFPQ
jgi:S-(hydroxymethyl)glutathione dehydrogenase/alcohol dehydrogenase